MSLISKTERFTPSYTKPTENKNKKRKKLEDFWIEYKNQDIFEALDLFSNSQQENKRNQLEDHKSQQEANKNQQEDNEIQENLRKIPERLIEALTDNDYLMNKNKWKKLHQEITDIKSSDIDKNLQNEKIKTTNDKNDKGVNINILYFYKNYYF